MHADAYRPCAGQVLGFMSIGVVVNNDILPCVQIGQDCCYGESPQATGRSVGPYAVGLYQAAGWLAAAARWAATVSRLKPLNQAVAAQRAATACT